MPRPLTEDQFKQLMLIRYYRMKHYTYREICEIVGLSKQQVYNKVLNFLPNLLEINVVARRKRIVKETVERLLAKNIVPNLHTRPRNTK